MSPPTTGKEIRASYLEFFRTRGHEIVPSAPVVVTDDPTLMFTNAGMNQFKDVFLGTGTRAYTRAADSQKCMRVSGKHNDLEDVGRDHYHHTLFEMLGNWSFGDYYKREAIAWHWELFTEVWGLPKDRLHATVFEDDDEAYEIWKDYVLDESYISRHGHKDNFWEMGDTGPCGPCSELHFDRGEEFTSVKNPGPNVDDERFRELGNLVFIQFNRQPDGTLVDLPAKHVDTGTGFERIVTLMQGKNSHYETDLFSPYIDWVAARSGVSYEHGEGGVPHRVIADHLRAVSFTVADGVIPSNEGSGYVIRRILRRAARYGQKLGLKRPFLHEMVPLLVESMGEAYPEVKTRQSHITEVIKSEEERFSVALEKGTKLFEIEAARLLEAGEKTVSGGTAFQLFDTHGFPVDLTNLLATEAGLRVDQEEFERLREAARVATQEASKQFKADHEVQACAEGVEATRFLGYDDLEATGTLARVVPIAESPGEYYFALDRTPCYAESGGQVADAARFEGPGWRAELVHCTKIGDVFVHRVRATGGVPARGEEVAISVDPAARAMTAANHTATHLLHEALKRVLGEHVAQAGSLVAPDRLRFDFAHSGPLTAEEVGRVEALVQEQIARDIDLHVEVMDRAAADSKGAVALFGEKYGDEVRVVEVPGFSTELCGGTHVARTGSIQTFRVLNQASVAANVRRIEALAGPALVDHLGTRSRQLEALAAALNCAPEDVAGRVEGLQREVKKLKKDLQAARKRGAAIDPAKLAEQAKAVAGKGFSLATAHAEGLTVPDLRDLSDVVLGHLGKGVVLLATSNEGKVHFVCKVEKSLAGSGVHAGKLISQVAQVAGGKGGGRPEMATAGAPDASQIDAALAKAHEVLAT